MSKANSINGNYFYNPSNGRTFPFTEELRKRGGLIPCKKADGSDAKMMLAGDDPANPGGAPVTKYLKNMNTGRVLLYSAVLAKSSNMIPWNMAEDITTVEPSIANEVGSADQPDLDDMPADTDADTNTDEEADEEVNEIDLEAMDKKQIQAFIKDTYGKHIDLRKAKMVEDVRALAITIIETSDPL